MKGKFVATISILGLMQLLHSAQAFIVNVDAHNEECFFEKIEAGTKFSKNMPNNLPYQHTETFNIFSILGVTFEVIEGGFLDIDIKVTGPDQGIMHQSEKESSSRLTFAAVTTGVYTVCFDNQKSSMTPKLVMFSIDVGESPHRAPGAPGEEDIGHTKLEDMIRELSGTLTSVKHEQEYMHVSKHKKM